MSKIESLTAEQEALFPTYVDKWLKIGLSTEKVDLYEMFLMVKEPTEINHLRSFDTHETLLVPPGNYVIKRQREYTPEGFRRAADQWRV